MRYEETEKLTEERLLRLTGVKIAVFGKMLAIYRAYLEKGSRRLLQ